MRDCQEEAFKINHISTMKVGGRKEQVMEEQPMMSTILESVELLRLEANEKNFSLVDVILILGMGK